jgi:CBS domain-containing protein
METVETSKGIFVDCDTEADVPRTELVDPPPEDEERVHTVADVMITDVVCVTPQLSLSELVQLFLEHEISGAPVLEGARVVGMVSKTDVVRAFEGQPMRVADLMTQVTLVLPAATTLEHAAAVMAYEGMHRVPVVSDTNEVVGLVTSLDLLRWVARRAGYVVPPHTALQAK